MTKLLVIGATGYIGGDALHAISDSHPNYDITCLVRNSDKGAQIAKAYPRIRLVYGDLDSEGLLEEAAKEADVVCNFANADHEGAARAIAKGLVAHPPASPAFYIHTSGTGILMHADLRAGTYGEKNAKVYNDLEGVNELTSLPADAPHRNVDKVVLAVGTEHSDRVRTAIVCPPAIYGQGRGPEKQRSHQLPDLAAWTLKKGHGLQVGAGKAHWHSVHVHDLSELFLKLVENAAAGGSLAEWPGKPAVWGAEGYYLCENGDFVWGELAAVVAKEAKERGHTGSDEVESISAEEASNLSGFGGPLWGANSRGQAKRAREALGWVPKKHSIEDEVKPSMDVEVARLGLKK